MRATRTFSLENVAGSVRNLLGAADEDPNSPEAIARRAEARKAALLASPKDLEQFVCSDIKSVESQLKTDVVRGLSDADARERLEEHGPNELTKTPPTPFWRLLLAQFQNLLVILLIAAAIISGALGEYEAAIIIIIIVILNAWLGVAQESKAGKELDALSSMTEAKAEVIRAGIRISIDSSKLVPGDLIYLAEGAKIPADCRLVESSNLQCNEMALTGESEPVPKNALFTGTLKNKTETKTDAPTQQPAGEQPEKKKEDKLTDPNMIHMGCHVCDGQGKAIVIKTGMETRMGEIATLLANADKGQSPLQIKLAGLGEKLAYASITISITVFVIGVTTGRGTDPEDPNPKWLQMLLVAVSLTVAAVPEGLPACVTITLAIGMKRMVGRGALIRNLHSVETLGSASVICSDKTGTLTKAEMTAVRLWQGGTVYRFTGAGFDPSSGKMIPMGVDPQDQNAVDSAAAELKTRRAHLLPLSTAALCSDAVLQQVDGKWECVGNTSERPLVVAAAKAGIDMKELAEQYPRLHTNPFNSKRKMMSTLVDCPDPRNNYFGAPMAACVKGAPNIVLNNCVGYVEADGVTRREITEEYKREVLQVIDEFSGEAFRVLAIAYQPLSDRPDSSEPGQLEKDLVLVGLVASIDPERPEVIPSIRKAAQAGIRVVMITGDYVKTAQAIARNIGILPKNSPPEMAIDCNDIRVIDDEVNVHKKAIADKQGDAKAHEEAIKKCDERLDAITARANVYARAKPIDKITIVRSLQRQGNVCSMTGDGVNDAPALKQANIGVAMGITGTDVAKAAASMVLTDDNFCSIVDAIEEGRVIYCNISKFVFYLLSTNVSEVFLILIAVIAGYPSPLSAIQILWLNLTTDGAPAIALAVEAAEPNIMLQGPRLKSEPLLEKVMLTGIFIQTCALTTTCLITYIVGLRWGTGNWNGLNHTMTESAVKHQTDVARTMCIYLIVFAELMRAYGARSMRLSVFSIAQNKWMHYGVGTAIAATLFVGLVPGLQDVFGMKYMPERNWGFVIGMAFIPVTVDEITKFVYRQIGFGLRPLVNRPVDDVSPAAKKEWTNVDEAKHNDQL